MKQPGPQKDGSRSGSTGPPQTLRPVELGFWAGTIWAPSQFREYPSIQALAQVPESSSSLAEAQTALRTPIWEED